MKKQTKQHKNFLISWRWQLEHSKLRPLTKLVLFVLSTHMNNDGGSCYPLIKTIMSESSLSNRSVIDHIAIAISSGWLVRKIRPHKGHGWRRYEYNATVPQHGVNIKSLVNDVPIPTAYVVNDVHLPKSYVVNDVHVNVVNVVHSVNDKDDEKTYTVHSISEQCPNPNSVPFSNSTLRKEEEIRNVEFQEKLDASTYKIPTPESENSQQIETDTRPQQQSAEPTPPPITATPTTRPVVTPNESSPPTRDDPTCRQNNRSDNPKALMLTGSPLPSGAAAERALLDAINRIGGKALRWSPTCGHRKYLKRILSESPDPEEYTKVLQHRFKTWDHSDFGTEYFRPETLARHWDCYRSESLRPSITKGMSLVERYKIRQQQNGDPNAETTLY